MEKLVYPLWVSSTVDGDTWRDSLLAETVPALLALPGTRALRLTAVDSAVAPAAAKRLARQEPLPSAVLSLWLDNGGDRKAQEQLLESVCERFETLLVTEAEPIVNTAHPPAADGRVPGFCQVVFLQTPPRLTREEWLTIWQGSHTRVAIDTQSNFAYRQNVVVRVLKGDVSAPDAMIEESFPDVAMTSDLAFYDAADEADLARRAQMMMDSCARFIDFDRIDVIPMSEYVFGSLLAPGR